MSKKTSRPRCQGSWHGGEMECRNYAAVEWRGVYLCRPHASDVVRSEYYRMCDAHHGLDHSIGQLAVEALLLGRDDLVPRIVEIVREAHVVVDAHSLDLIHDDGWWHAATPGRVHSLQSLMPGTFGGDYGKAQLEALEAELLRMIERYEREAN